MLTLRLTVSCIAAVFWLFDLKPALLCMNGCLPLQQHSRVTMVLKAQQMHKARLFDNLPLDRRHLASSVPSQPRLQHIACIVVGKMHSRTVHLVLGGNVMTTSDNRAQAQDISQPTEIRLPGNHMQRSSPLGMLSHAPFHALRRHLLCTARGTTRAGYGAPFDCSLVAKPHVISTEIAQKGS